MYLTCGALMIFLLNYLILKGNRRQQHRRQQLGAQLQTPQQLKKLLIMEIFLSCGDLKKFPKEPYIGKDVTDAPTTAAPTTVAPATASM